MQSLRINSNKISNRDKRIIFITLIGIIIITLSIISIGFIDNNIYIESDHLKITGPYGTVIELNEIDSIILTRERPSVIRISGFKLGYRKKGRFKNKRGDELLMLINSKALPWILIQKKDGNKIYYSHSSKSNEIIFKKLKETVPNNTYNPSRSKVFAYFLS